MKIVNNYWLQIGLTLLVYSILIVLLGFIKTTLLLLLIGSIFFGFKKRKEITEGVRKMKLFKKKHKEHKERKKKKIWSTIGVLFLLLFIFGLLAIGGFIGYIVVTSPEFNPENLYRKGSSVVYDSDGKVIDKIGREIREKITYNQIPQVFTDALVATEDSRFFQHNGFDLPRFVKASLGQAMGQDAGGASTLSMQVVKNNFTSTKQSIIRKFRDIYLSIFKLERQYSKEEIIEFYVNAPFLGNNSYGISEAAKNYFGKDISDINLSEAAMLAGLFQAPGTYDPYRNPKKTTERRSVVLGLMVRHGYITEEEAKMANAIPIEKLIKPISSSDNPYQGYVDAVVEEVIAKTGNNPNDVPMKIYTNLNTTKQNWINDVLSGKQFAFPNERVQAGVAVVDVNTGAVVALGNGRNRTGERLFNFATMLKRQIGSTAKPIFDYGPAFEYNNWSTYNLILDDVYTYTGGKPIKNWDSKYMGIVTTRLALVESRNIPALKVFQQVDNKKIVEFSRSLGMTPDVDGGYIHEAHAIGAFSGASPMQMASAYAAFANGGFYIEPHFVNKITYIEDNKDKIFKYEKTQVMSDSTAYMITDMLKWGVQTGRIPGKRVTGVEVAAKTGTTNLDAETLKKYGIPSNSSNDLWVTSYTPEYAMSMWYGYEKLSSENYHKEGASTYRNNLFTTFAMGVYANATKKTFSIPTSIVRVEVEKDTVPAMLPSEFTPADMRTTEYFKKGTEPTTTSQRFARLSNVTGLDASSSDTGIKLTWKEVMIDEQVSEEYLAMLGNQRDKYLGIRDAYNASVLGTIQYQIYRKDENGLSLLKTTSDTSYTDVDPSIGTNTYVVKTCYSIFKNNISSGVEITASASHQISLIDVSLVGPTTVTISIGELYKDAGFKVLDNLVDRTNDATSTHTSTIDKNTAGTYSYQYIVKYNNETYTLKRTVIVK